MNKLILHEDVADLGLPSDDWMISAAPCDPFRLHDLAPTPAPPRGDDLGLHGVTKSSETDPADHVYCQFTRRHIYCTAL